MPDGILVNGTPDTVAPVPEDLPDAETHVRRLQLDARLLTGFVAGRADKSFSGTPALGPRSPDQGEQRGTAGLARLLYAPPRTLCRNPADVDALIALVDRLAREASPANAATIRLTAAYTECGPGEVSDAEVAAARNLKRMVRAISYAALALLLAGLVLLGHAASGRSMLDNLGQLRTVRADAQRDVAAANAALLAGIAASQKTIRLVDCEPLAEAVPGNLDARATACNKRSDADFRMSLVYAQLTRWNAASRAAGWLMPVGILENLAGPRLRVPGTAFEGTELRTEVTLKVLTSFILPLVLSFVGAAAAFARLVMRKIESSSLEPRDQAGGVLRVALGSICGSLVGAVFAGNEPLNLQGITLTLPVIAFFVGYAVTVVFDLLDGLIEATRDRIKSTFTRSAPPPVR
ncbi:hypothetical protein ACE7GA_00725 [Roseomonas sp. CCTCC AB2023176]|uniref:hypothetical protein n=1 Tax=Roseomonas sp. CCTCC AB2023176 TaxID=3342640 RepID=UPI0035D92920